MLGLRGPRQGGRSPFGRAASSALLSFFALGCGLTSSTRVRVADVRTQPPAEVELVVSVHDAEGPVQYLDETSFFVAENDVELDPELGPVSFGDPSEIATEVVILVDTSSVNEPEIQKGLARGLVHLVEKLKGVGRTELLSFQGEAEPRARLVVTSDSDPPDVLPLLQGSGDNARNLNGAVVMGIDALAESARQRTPYFGMLVIITFGSDTAGRVSNQDLWKKVDSNHFPVYSAVPEGVSVDNFDDVERVEFTREDLPQRLMDLGMMVRSELEALYLVRYCSSARSGQRTLAVRVHYEGSDGTPRGGRASAAKSIDTSHFAAGCKIERAKSSHNDDTLAEVPVDEAPPEEDLAPGSSSPPAAHAGKAARTQPKAAHPKAKRPRTPTEPPVVAPPSGEDYR
jgi:hypothetical protein